MVDKSALPRWLSRGIEEYFPIKDTDQTFAEKIDRQETEILWDIESAELIERNIR